MNRKVMIITLSMLILFTVSLFTIPPSFVGTRPQDSSGSPLREAGPVAPQTPAEVLPANYTHVQWEQGTNSESWNDTQSWSNWEFGPSITWTTRNATTSNLIELNDTIGVDGWVNFILKVPKNALEGKSPKYIVFLGSYFNFTQFMAEKYGYTLENATLPSFVVVFDLTFGTWNLYSSKNATFMSSGPGTGPSEGPAPATDLPPDWTLEDMFGPPLEPFMEINVPGCGYYPGAENLWTQFQLKFNSTAPLGLYRFHAIATDIDLNALAESKDTETSVRSVGVSFEKALQDAVGGYYSVNRVDDSGATLYSVSRSVDFNTTYYISGQSPGAAILLFSIPTQIEVEQLIEGPYQQTSERTGGWQYDPVAQTYFWNASLVISYTEELFGLHWETVRQFRDPTIEYTYYDPHIGGDTIGYAEEMVAVIYWFANNSFSLKLYHEEMTFVNDPYGGHLEPRDVFRPYPSDGSIPTVYILNETASGFYIDGDRKVVVFRGHFSNDLLPTGPDNPALRMQTIVKDTMGRTLFPYAWMPFADSEELAQFKRLEEIAIDSPVSYVQLRHADEPYEPSWMFATQRGETFTVKSRLQGGAPYASDIDGVALRLQAWQYIWDESGNSSWSQESEVDIWVKVLPDGTSDITVYNNTHRTEYTYGTTYEWQYVEIFPGYWDWQYVEYTGYYWAEMWWDFEANSWTTMPPNWHSNQTIMNVNYLNVGNLSYVVIGNDLSIEFDVVPTAQMPELEWQWDYYYGNLTWVKDYEGGWGAHTILDWTDMLVYRYLNNSERVYMDGIERKLVMRDNDTEALYPTTFVPYIVLGSEKLYVEQFKQVNLDGSIENLVLFKEWNSTAYNEYSGTYDGDWQYYYKLENGTRLYVNKGRRVGIFNVTLNNGTTFLSPTDYSFVHVNSSFKWMYDIYGNIVSDLDPMIANASLMDLIEVDKVGLGAVVNDTKIFYMATYPVWTGNHYIIYKNATWEKFDAFWGYCPEYDRKGYYFFDYTENATYWFFEDIWPQDVYVGWYKGQKVIVLDSTVDYYMYTTVKSVNYGLPKPGMFIYDYYDLDVSTPRDTKVLIDGQWVNITEVGSFENLELGYNYTLYQANVSSVIYNLTKYGTGFQTWEPNEVEYPYTSIANGSIYISDLKFKGWRVAYGHINLNTHEFEVDGWLNVTTGYFDSGGEHLVQIYESDAYDYVRTSDGFIMNYTIVNTVFVYNITLSNGTSFYSGEEVYHDYSVHNKTTDVYEFKYWYTWDLEGNMVTWTDPVSVTNTTIVYADKYNATSHMYQIDGVWYNATTYSVSGWNFEKQQWESWSYNSYVNDDYPVLVNGTQTLRVYDVLQDNDFRYNLPRFNFTLDGLTWWNVTSAHEMIYRLHSIWGYGYKWDYEPLPITILRDQYSLVVGNPQYGMWDINTWTIDDATGALDLDGDLSTTNDQFYVKKEFNSVDNYNVTEDYLQVSIMWEPDNTTIGDEFYVDSYTGLVTVNWSYYWEDNYYWYNATSGELLTPAEFNTYVNSTIFDGMGNPKPGYWGISWMAQNFTSDDLKQKALEEGWAWAIDDSQEWSWIWWQMSEHYGSEMPNGTYVSVDVWYEYAGMFAWNDTNNNDIMDFNPTDLTNSEATHYWLPTSFEGVTFTTPNSSLTGDAIWDVNASIPFGVMFNNVSGTAFPFGSYSYWDWYTGSLSGDFATFEDRPAEANVTQFGIGATFQGFVNTSGGMNHGDVKFNLTAGDWTVDAPGGRSVLDGLSLGMAFYTDVMMVSETGTLLHPTYLDQYNNPVSGNQTIGSANYTLAAESASIASMNLGGAYYSWSKNKSANFTVVDSQTVPVEAFETAYMDEGGMFATPFEVSSSQFYTLIDFKWWDGYAVTVDPVFVSYSSSTGVNDNIAPTINSFDQSRRFVDNKERLYFDLSITDTGGSGVAEVRVVNLDDLSANTTLEFNSDTKSWTGYVEMVGTDPYTFNGTIEVYDYAGNMNSTGTFSHKFWNDPVFPTISSTGLMSDSGKSYAHITASVSDIGSGINRVQIYVLNTESTYDMQYNATLGRYEAYISRTGTFSYDMAYRIIVYDNADNMATSSILTYHFVDAQAPVIYSVTGVTGDVGGNEVLVVEASVTDEGGSGLKSVSLTYTIGGSPTTVAMTYDSGKALYTYTVPNQSPGTYVFYTVTATDNEDNVATSSEQVYRFSSEGDTPPGMGTLSIEPSSPTSSDSVNVSVTVLDDGTIVNVTLYYQVDGGSWNTVLMTANGNTYWGIIPAQSNGANVTYYVIAYDNLDQSTQSPTYWYVVSDDVSPPTISVSIDNAHPTSADSVTVTAVVTDDTGVLNVTLYYKVGDGLWVAVTMNHLSGDSYAATIPPQADGSVVTYYVRAFDQSGKHADSPQQSYTVQDSTTTTTTPTTTTPGPVGGFDPMVLIIIGVAGVAVVVLALILKLRKFK